ncbi:hypothetical protein BAU15_12400 [Enterococcus sp. JM4C]|uniref:ABC transporter ATP-binding protein n=1 Tax=Candidatus Enterococcus huntleyi TaxID=1857217 RepID=UPI001379FC70|nr:ABC transporter ATP-binding protein [Enterococcus sp. JM4C]KAF1296073.1 hypothetical protein BAU15_12400 [Enterococcus sp. JM4C]
MLTIERLTKKFGSHVVLNEIDMSIEKNDFYGLVGKNGAGKTTLINLIAGINQPDEGKILFNHQPLSSEYKDLIGLMPDSEGLPKNSNGYDFLNYMGKLKKVNLSQSEIKQLLNNVCLDVSKHLSIKKYSFGMKKKLAIAQALIGEPQIIILDEPTSGVDPESAIHLRRLFTDLHNAGKTILLTSHNLEEVEKMCNKLSFIENGHLSVSGEIATLIKNNQSSIQLIITFETAYTHDELLGKTKNLPFTFDLEYRNNRMIIDCSTLAINQILSLLLQLEDFKIVELATEKNNLEQILF